MRLFHILVEVMMEYTEYLFSENGYRRYALTDKEISIAGKGLNVTMQLEGLESEYRIISRRSPAFLVGVVGLVLSISFGGYSAFYETPDFISLPMTFAISFAAISLLVLFLSLGTVERAIFKSTAGPDLIEISQAGPDVEKFGTFVNEVSSRISCAKLQD